MLASLELEATIKNAQLIKGLKEIDEGVGDVATRLNASQNALKNFEDRLKKATSPKDIEVLSKSITALKSKIEVLNASQNNLLGTQNKFTAGANQAGNALTNLGRVAQDAPFGFIGIANNLNPLLESFQRLKTETGSAQGAFKALGGSLMGAGGLGLALSLVTAAVAFSEMGFRAWGVENEEAKKKVEDHKKAIDNIYSSVSGEAVKVQTLIAVLQSETATRQKKLATLEELKKIQPEIFNGLKLEGSAVVGLDAAYIKYLNSLKTVIAVKIKQQELEKVTEELLRKEGVTLDRAGKAVAAFSKARLEAAKITTGNLAKDEENAKTVIKLQAIENKNTKEKNKLQLEAKAIIQDIADLQSGVTVNETKSNTGVKESTKEKITYLQELQNALNETEAKFNLRIIGFDEFIKNNNDAYNKAIDQAIKIKEPTKLVQELVSKVVVLPNIKGAESTASVINIDPKFVVNEQRAKELNAKMSGFLKTALAPNPQIIEDQSSQLANIMQTTYSNAFANFGEGLAGLINGTSGLQDVFSGLFRVFGDGFAQFGKQIIIQSTLMAKISAALKATKFGTSIALGLGMIAAGTLMKGLKIGANAQGTDYWRGGLTMVGERGPELISLPRGARVTPNHEMGGIGGSMAVDIQPITIFRGTELMVYFDRVNKQKNIVG